MADVENPVITEVGANNIAPPPDGLPALSSPNAVYPDWRELAAMAKRWWNRVNPTITSGGSANAQTLTFGVAPTQGYVLGQTYAFIAGFANTGAMTINVNGLGTKNVQANGAALVGGELRVGLIVEIAYDGTQFQIIGGAGSGAGAYLPLAGGSMAGNLTLNSPAALVINGPAGTARTIAGQTTGSGNRWLIVPGNSTAEGGGNTGSDFAISRYSDAPAFLDNPLIITRSTGQVAIKGTSAADSAAAGFVGEVISSVITSGVTLTTATPTNLTSITLTPGDWDVRGEIWIAVGTGGATNVAGGINSVSATMPATVGMGATRAVVNTALSASSLEIFPLNTCRVSLATSTVYYLIVQSVFPSGTTTATGLIWARRAR